MKRVTLLKDETEEAVRRLVLAKYSTEGVVANEEQKGIGGDHGCCLFQRFLVSSKVMRGKRLAFLNFFYRSTSRQGSCRLLLISLTKSWEPAF